MSIIDLIKKYLGLDAAASDALVWTSVAITVAIAVLTIVAMWKLFTKAGEKGWKAIIPIYDLYILCKLVWSKKAFWSLFVAILLSCVCSAIIPYVGDEKSAGAIVLGIFGLVVAIFEFVFYIMLDIKTSYAYGHGAGYAVGLVFLNTIFIWILGFGSSQYTGSWKKSNN